MHQEWYERTGCRQCAEQLSFRARLPYPDPAAQLHYAPNRPLVIEHITLDLDVDPEGCSLEGTVTQRVRAVADGTLHLVLDQVDLAIRSVHIDEVPAPYTSAGDRLHVTLPGASVAGASFVVRITYSLRHPRRGIYFTAPDEDDPHKPFQVWTQGQDEDARYWFPTLDYPNQKMTSEMIVRVPKTYTAISNGALISTQELPQQTQFHYRLEVPHVSYLITLVIGRWDHWEVTGPRGLPVQYFVAKGRREDGERAFGRTVDMIEAFERVIGVSYPYAKYSQVAVQDFIFGGMENTSATTQTDLTLHDERAHLDFSSDALVAHELAHQWFGNYVTCRDWSHGWLNEGFATFMERVWVECLEKPHGGVDEAQVIGRQQWNEYYADDQSHYRRPIVSRHYVKPIDLFDTHLYQKGGLVLNLLRHLLGAGPFWRAIRFYLQRHAQCCVETTDLILAIEESTGQNMRQFFDEWVYGSGFPEYQVSYTWHPERLVAEWVVEQKQAAPCPLFHAPIVLRMVMSDGQIVDQRLEPQSARERIFIPLPSAPRWVRLDPGAFIPKTLKFPRPKALLIEQLRLDSDCLGRIEALQELAQMPDTEVTTAMKTCLLEDPFWAVQSEAAKQLGIIHTTLARQALLAGLLLPHPKARRAVVQALGAFHELEVRTALKPLVQSDPSYFVEAAATSAWASSHRDAIRQSARVSTSTELARTQDEVQVLLLAQLGKPSYREVIRSAALNALALLPLAEGEEAPHVREALVTWSRRGQPLDARLAALRACAKALSFADRSRRRWLLAIFEEASHESGFRLRMTIVAALGEAAQPETLGILRRILIQDGERRVQKAAEAAIAQIEKAQSAPESIEELRQDLKKLREEHLKLAGRWEEQAVKS